MTPPLPLAEASLRLRGRPGRPRKTDAEKKQAAEERRARTIERLADTPQRLFDLRAAAVYLGRVSPWTLRDLEAGGVLPRVRVPLPGGGELRKVLFDRADLDRLIELWKETAPR